MASAAFCVAAKPVQPKPLLFLVLLVCCAGWLGWYLLDAKESAPSHDPAGVASPRETAADAAPNQGEVAAVVERNDATQAIDSHATSQQPAASPSGLTGIVRDEQGTPIAGVKISVSKLLFGFAKSAATSDAEGRFALHDLSLGEWTLRTSMPQFVPLVMAVKFDAASASELVLTLVRGAAVSGRVVDDLGAPVAGCLVACQRSEASGGMRVERFSANEGTTTDAAGCFTLAGLTGESVLLRAQSAQHSETIAEQVLVGSGDVQLVVKRFGKLEGVLLATDGTPLAGSSITVQAKPDALDDLGISAHGLGPSRFSTITAADGTFTLEHVPAGVLTLVGSGKQHLQASLTGLELAPGETRRGVRMTAATGTKVFVTVRDASGALVAGAQVRSQRPAKADEQGGITLEVRGEDSSEHAGRAQTASTDAQGQVTLVAMPSGPTEFRASHERFADSLPLLLHLPADGRVEGSLVLRVPGYAEVAVFATDGSPVADARFKVIGPSEQEAKQHNLQTDQTGKQRVGPLVPGSYRAVLISREESITVGTGTFVLPGNAAEFANSERHFTVRAGETTVLDLRKPLLVTLTGRVLGADGPVAACQVSLKADLDELDFGDFGGQVAMTDAAGQYRIAEVMPGRVLLRFGLPNSLVKARQVVDVVGDRPEQAQDLLLRTGALRTQVVAASNGEPIADATVELQVPDEGNGKASSVRRTAMIAIVSSDSDLGSVSDSHTITIGDNRAHTGADGWVTIENVPVGSYRVVARHDAYCVNSVAEQFVVERQVTEVPQLQLQAAGGIRGTLRDPAAAVNGMVEVECALAAGGSTQSRIANGGQFQFSALQPGTYRLRARTITPSARGAWGAPVDVEVAAGAQATAEVGLAL